MARAADEDENQRTDDATLEKIWATLPNQICHRHRTLARNVKPTPDNPRPTDWNIDELRKEDYSSYGEKYFRNHMIEVANRHSEIQVEGDAVRLTPQGIEYCKANVPGVLDDF